MKIEEKIQQCYFYIHQLLQPHRKFLLNITIKIVIKNLHYSHFCCIENMLDK